MSFYFRIFLSAIMIIPVLSFLGIQKADAETYRVYGIVSSDVLYIRAWPSSKSRKIGSIPPYGKGVEKLGPCEGNWCKVSYHGMVGWASMKYLTREASTGSSYRVRGIRSDDVLYIRAWPSAKSKKVGSIPPDGRGVNKLGPCKGNWCKISYRGITGWSSMMYLVADGAAKPVAPAYTPPLQYAAPAPAPPKPAGKPFSTTMASLLISSKKFQETAITNFPRALKSYSSGRGSLQLHGINATLWTEKSFPLGWMSFFNSAVRVFTKNPGRLPIIGYYNPYSDTMLVTIWKRKRGVFRIVDADMIMGDLLRRSRKKPNYKPALIRLINVSEEWHSAVGFIVSRTILAFEKNLSNATTRNWRNKLWISGRQASVRKLNIAGISIMANSHLGNVGLYIDPDTSNVMLEGSKRIVSRTIRLLIDGRVDQALNRARNSSSANVTRVLRKMPPEWYKTMRTSLAVGSSEKYIVYLTPYKTTNICLSMTIKSRNGGSYLDRIDMIDFQSFYASVKKHKLQ